MSTRASSIPNAVTSLQGRYGARTRFLVFPANGGPAQNLCLAQAGEDCATVVVVQSGDYCQLVANAANIPLTTLFANNPNIYSNCTNIYPDEVRFNHTSPHSDFNPPTGSVRSQRHHQLQLGGTVLIFARETLAIAYSELQRLLAPSTIDHVSC